MNMSLFLTPDCCGLVSVFSFVRNTTTTLKGGRIFFLHLAQACSSGKGCCVYPSQCA